VQKQRAEKRRKLFAIPLTDYALLKKWERLDSATGEALAAAVRKYHLPDFSNWKNHDAFNPPTSDFGVTSRRDRPSCRRKRREESLTFL